MGTNEVFSKVRFSSSGWLRLKPRRETNPSLEFISPTETERRVVRGGSVSLDCSVRGHNPEITWLRTFQSK